uniref:Uncharacterized protein n=1 Tax=Cacopsylla melanoneura TaxID=428564 RepID=A0A8D9E923_9HEMI
MLGARVCVGTWKWRHWGSSMTSVPYTKKKPLFSCDPAQDRGRKKQKRTFLGPTGLHPCTLLCSTALKFKAFQICLGVGTSPTSLIWELIVLWGRNLFFWSRF